MDTVLIVSGGATNEVGDLLARISGRTHHYCWAMNLEPAEVMYALDQAVGQILSVSGWREGGLELLAERYLEMQTYERPTLLLDSSEANRVAITQLFGENVGQINSTLLIGAVVLF